MGPESTPALQRLLFLCVTHEDGVAAGAKAARAEGLLAGPLRDAFPDNARLSAEEQVGVYAFMYGERLLDVLRGEYPSLVVLFGEEPFDRLARAFLGAHPSVSWSLDALSTPFPGWLRGPAAVAIPSLAPLLPFAADLAAVERVLEEIVDAPPDEPVPHAALQAIPPDRWGALRLVPIRAARLVPVDHPVHDWLDASREDRREPPPLPSPRVVLVSRLGYSRHRRELDPREARLLAALWAGSDVNDALDAALHDADEAGEEALMASLSGWFEGWFRDGLFHALQEP